MRTWSGGVRLAAAGLCSGGVQAAAAFTLARR